MKFPHGDIPDMHLKLLGLDRELMGRLLNCTLKPQLSDAYTTLMRFSLTRDTSDTASAGELEAKLSLSRKRNRGVKMKVHLARPGITDSVQHDPVERDRLSKGNGTEIRITILDMDGKERRGLVEIDPAIDTSMVFYKDLPRYHNFGSPEERERL